MLFRTLLFGAVLLGTIVSCDNILQPEGEDSDTLFVSGVVTGLLENPEIEEASGLAAGILNENTLWVHNDSGNKARIFCMSEKGENRGEYFLQQLENRDWESMASVKDQASGVSYFYVADSGGNWDSLEVVKIFRFPEPSLPENEDPVIDTILNSSIEEINLKYPNGKNDAECIMYDPLTQDLFIITKGKTDGLIFKAAHPQEIGKEILLEAVGNISYSGITGGDISADGGEVLLRTYANIYYWKRQAGQSIEDLLMTKPVKLSYEREPQGECIAWKKDGSGFFTTSEKAGGIDPVLKFYARK